MRLVTVIVIDQGIRGLCICMYCHKASIFEPLSLGKKGRYNITTVIQ